MFKKARVFVDEVNMRSAASFMMGERQPLFFDYVCLAKTLSEITQWEIETIVMSSIIYLDENNIEYEKGVDQQLLNDRAIDLRPGLVGAMVEYACKQENAAIVLLSGDSHMRTAVLSCLRLGACVHVVGVQDKISPSLCSITTMNTNLQVSGRALDELGIRPCLDQETKRLPKIQPRICRWFYADNVPGKPVSATSTWPEGCKAHMSGLCPDVHPDQIEWQSVIDRISKSPCAQHPCRKGFFCPEPRSCGFGHSAKQLSRFDLVRSATPKRKTAKCPRMARCRFARNPSACSFLHDGEIRLCSWCNCQHEPDCFATRSAIDFAN